MLVVSYIMLQYELFLVTFTAQELFQVVSLVTEQCESVLVRLYCISR